MGFWVVGTWLGSSQQISPEAYPTVYLVLGEVFEPSSHRICQVKWEVAYDGKVLARASTLTGKAVVFQPEARFGVTGVFSHHRLGAVALREYFSPDFEPEGSWARQSRPSPPVFCVIVASAVAGVLHAF